jgi:hypothetical protein
MWLARLTSRANQPLHFVIIQIFFFKSLLHETEAAKWNRRFLRHTCIQSSIRGSGQEVVVAKAFWARPVNVMHLGPCIRRGNITRISFFIAFCHFQPATPVQWVSSIFRSKLWCALHHLGVHVLRHSHNTIADHTRNFTI